MSAIQSSEATFAQDVLESPVPVVVDFWAPWCGPCRMISPILDEIATEKGEAVRIVKVNVDDNPALAAKFGVSSIPNLIFFKAGEAKGQLTGARPKQDILGKLDELL